MKITKHNASKRGKRSSGLRIKAITGASGHDRNPILELLYTYLDGFSVSELAIMLKMDEDVITSSLQRMEALGEVEQAGDFWKVTPRV